MDSFNHSIIKLSIILLVCGCVAFLAFGITAMWMALAVILFLWAIIHLINLAKLVKWLERRSKSPNGSGVWGEVFGLLHAKNKKSRKRKQKLTRALRRFNQMAEAIPTGIVILNSQGRIEWINKYACRDSNLDKKNDGNSILKNLIRIPEFHHFMEDPINAIDKKGLKITLMDDELFPKYIRLKRIPFEENTELLTTQDITLKEQYDANQVAFVANVSHELRTPLTVVNGFLETLAETPDLPKEQRQKFIETMQKEGNRMQSVLADLLTLSHLEQGENASDKYQLFSLSTMTALIIEECEHLSREQHNIIKEIDGGIHFLGNYKDIHSALSNLAFNAVRYTPEGGDITIKLEKLNDKQARFSVKDTGIGIPHEHIPRLTERFYRVDNGRSRATGGTGLGLSITKFALAKYHTHLDIESELGKGSTFSVVLPIKDLPTPK